MGYLFIYLFKHPIVWFQKTVPCDLCKEVLMVVEQILKDNATEVRFKKRNLCVETFDRQISCLELYQDLNTPLVD